MSIRYIYFNILIYWLHCSCVIGHDINSPIEALFVKRCKKKEVKAILFRLQETHSPIIGHKGTLSWRIRNIEEKGLVFLLERPTNKMTLIKDSVNSIQLPYQNLEVRPLQLKQTKSNIQTA